MLTSLAAIGAGQRWDPLGVYGKSGSVRCSFNSVRDDLGSATCLEHRRSGNLDQRNGYNADALGMADPRRKFWAARSTRHQQGERGLDRWRNLSIGRRKAGRGCSGGVLGERLRARAILPSPEQAVQSLTTPAPLAVLSLLSSIPGAWGSLPAAVQIPFVMGFMAFTAMGLGPAAKALRKMITGKELDWESSKTKLMLGSYVRPMLFWVGVLVLCRSIGRIPVGTEAGLAVKERIIKFVSTLATVTVFASCTVSLVQYLQNVLMESPPKQMVDEKDPPQRAQAANEVGIKFAGSVVSTLVWVAAVCLFMELLGFKTQRWVTAGGFGTVLITLAGREIVTNFLSSIMIHATRPFLINDWIQTKIEGQEVSGTVEHVGWWSPTVVRGDDREAVHIPNHKFSVSVVRNLSQKTHWRVKAHFGISHYDNHKIRSIVSDMRKVLANHPLVEQQRLHRRVFLEFIEPNSQALMILVSCFVKTSQFEEYLQVKETLLMDLLRVVSSRNARLATPIRSIQRLLDETEAFRGAAQPDMASQRPPQVLLLESKVLSSSEDDSDDEEEAAEREAVTVADAGVVSEPSVTQPEVTPEKEEAEQRPPPELPTRGVPPNAPKLPGTEEVPATSASTDAGVSTGPDPVNGTDSQTPLKDGLPDNRGFYAPEKSLSDEDFLTSPVTARVADPVPIPSLSGIDQPRTRKEKKAVVRAEVRRQAREGIVGVGNGEKGSEGKKGLAAVGAAGSNGKDVAVPPPPPQEGKVGKPTTLAGLDSMGLNEDDITLLGAAFEKPPANIPDGPLESGPYVDLPLPKGGSDRIGGEEGPKKGPQQLEEVVAKSAAASKASQPQQLEDVVAKSMSAKSGQPQQLEELVVKSLTAKSAQPQQLEDLVARSVAAKSSQSQPVQLEDLVAKSVAAKTLPSQQPLEESGAKSSNSKAVPPQQLEDVVAKSVAAKSTQQQPEDIVASSASSRQQLEDVTAKPAGNKIAPPQQVDDASKPKPGGTSKPPQPLEEVVAAAVAASKLPPHQQLEDVGAMSATAKVSQQLEDALAKSAAASKSTSQGQTDGQTTARPTAPSVKASSTGDEKGVVTGGVGGAAVVPSSNSQLLEDVVAKSMAGKPLGGGDLVGHGVGGVGPSSLQRLDDVVAHAVTTALGGHGQQLLADLVAKGVTRSLAPEVGEGRETDAGHTGGLSYYLLNGVVFANSIEERSGSGAAASSSSDLLDMSSSLSAGEDGGDSDAAWSKLNIRVIGPQGMTMEELLEDPWHVNNREETARSSDTSPASSSVMQNVGGERSGLGGGGGEAKDAATPTLASRLPQTVEENLVLGVALDGPKRTLPLGDELGLGKKEERGTENSGAREMAVVGSGEAASSSLASSSGSPPSLTMEGSRDKDR